jgi:hypothetical protein
VPPGWPLGRPVLVVWVHSRSARPAEGDVAVQPDLRIVHHYNVDGCRNAAAGRNMAAVGHNAAALGHNFAAVGHNAAARTPTWRILRSLPLRTCPPS